MAPAFSRQRVLVWSLAPVALLFSYFWYKRKKSTWSTDPGGTFSGETQNNPALADKVSADKGQRDTGLNYFSEALEDSIQFTSKRKRVSSETRNVSQESAQAYVCVTAEVESESKYIVCEVDFAISPTESDTKSSTDLDSGIVCPADSTIDEVDCYRSECEVVSSLSDSCEENISSSVPSEVPSSTSTVAEEKVVNFCVNCKEVVESDSVVQSSKSECTSICDSFFGKEESIQPSPCDQLLACDEKRSECENVDSEVSSCVEAVNISSGNVSEVADSTSSASEIPDKSEVAFSTNFPNVADHQPVREGKECSESESLEGGNCSSPDDTCRDSNFTTSTETDSCSTSKDPTASEDSISSSSALQTEQSNMARKSTTDIESEAHGSQDHESEVPSKANNPSDRERWLEEKLAAIELGNGMPASQNCDTSMNCDKTRRNEVSDPRHSHQRERDSANHSPSEAMLASPSMSNYSDEHSEGSCDSGKGGSDLITSAGSVDVELGYESPSQTPASGSSLSGDIPSVFEFIIPQHLVGRLIGRHGTYVNQIKAKTRASIFIKRHPETTTLKICAVEGTQMEIESALEMIRQKFPVKKYPSVTLEQVCFVSPFPSVQVNPECLQLNLVEGVSNDVILSSLVNADHFFLQQPTHPTYPELHRLDGFMVACYSEPSVPGIPPPVEAGVICAAPTMGGWYRAQVMSVDKENETCNVKYVDYGGYQTLPASQLKQIRSDFMTLPFQAAECYLSHVRPLSDFGEWPREAMELVEAMTQGRVLQAQVTGYAEDGVPTVHLYVVHGSVILWVNQELVNRGLGEWMHELELDEQA